jgi:hypothetical protein
MLSQASSCRETERAVVYMGIFKVSYIFNIENFPRSWFLNNKTVGIYSEVRLRNRHTFDGMAADNEVQLKIWKSFCGNIILIKYLRWNYALLMRFINLRNNSLIVESSRLTYILFELLIHAMKYIYLKQFYHFVVSIDDLLIQTHLLQWTWCIASQQRFPYWKVLFQ